MVSPEPKQAAKRRPKPAHKRVRAELLVGKVALFLWLADEVGAATQRGPSRWSSSRTASVRCTIARASTCPGFRGHHAIRGSGDTIPNSGFREPGVPGTPGELRMVSPEPLSPEPPRNLATTCR